MPYFNGYCPVCNIKAGRSFPLNLNDDDFYECGNCNSQIAIMTPGVQAVLLKFKGSGNFRKPIKNDLNIDNGELLFPQKFDDRPFCDDTICFKKDEILSYIEEHQLGSDNSDFTKFLTSKNQILELISRADDNKITKELILRFNNLKQLRQPFYLTEIDLNEILKWKLRGQFNRQTNIRKKNTEENIITITTASFVIKHPNEDYETELKLKILTSLAGVEIPVASAILTLCFPDKYSVIDFRNLRKIYPNEKSIPTYTFKKYVNYLNDIKKIAKRFDLTPQQIDLAIWQHDK